MLNLLQIAAARYIHETVCNVPGTVPGTPEYNIRVCDGVRSSQCENGGNNCKLHTRYTHSKAPQALLQKDSAVVEKPKRLGHSHTGAAPDSARTTVARIETLCCGQSRTTRSVI